MASLSTYLAWQGTGELECGEDAGRAGVGAAALVGFEIFALLESRAADASDEELALTRQILPWLPSFASEFVDRADELERDASAVADSGSCPSHVRADVAAMRDALVRNAGPVALFAAESALEEAAGSSYADALLEPLTERLRRYFNCAPALDRLRSMRALGAFPSRDAADAVDELERRDGGFGGDRRDARRIRSGPPGPGGSTRRRGRSSSPAPRARRCSAL